MKKLFNFMAFLCLGFALSWTLTACGDDDEDGDNKDKEEQNDQNDDEDDSVTEKNARTLSVTIDESGLTYDDLTIHVNDIDIVHNNVPFGKVKVTIDDLPVSVAEIKKLKLPSGMTSFRQSPYLQPMLIVAALNQMNYNKDNARKMLDYVVKSAKSENRDGKMVHFPGDDVTTAYPSNWSQINQYKSYDKVRSYLDGANYANNYTPEKPYTMTMTLTNYSYTADPDYVQLWLTSIQLNTPRELGIWKYDSDNDGEYDTYWSSTFMHLLHSIAEY